MAFGFTFQKCSIEGLQATDAEGKNPHWEWTGNLDEPS